MKLVLSNGTTIDLPDEITVEQAEFLRLHEELHIQYAKLPRPTSLYVIDPKVKAILEKMGLM